MEMNEILEGINLRNREERRAMEEGKQRLR